VSFLQKISEFLRNYESNENITIDTAPARYSSIQFYSETTTKIFRLTRVLIAELMLIEL